MRHGCKLFNMLEKTQSITESATIFLCLASAGSLSEAVINMRISRLTSDVVLEPVTCHLRRRTYLLVLVLVLSTPGTKCGRAAHSRLLLVAKPSGTDWKVSPNAGAGESGACPKPNAA